MTIKPFLSDQGVISYLIITKNNQAILIDPGFDMAQNIVKELKQVNERSKEISVELRYILETHTHADFFSSRKLFKALYPKAQIGLSQNAPTKDNELKISDGQLIVLDGAKIVAWQTTGHTNDSLIFVVEETRLESDLNTISDVNSSKNSNTRSNTDASVRQNSQETGPSESQVLDSDINKGKLQNPNQKYIFTGDTLLIGGTGRTDFQLGDSHFLYQSLQRILTLSDNTVIYPGHNYQRQTKTTLGVEKITNTRLKLALENKYSQFLEIMENHKPPKPELFEESLVWNSF